MLPLQLFCEVKNSLKNSRMNILMHLFRYILLLAIGIVFLFFAKIDKKLEIMVGWIIGATLAYIVGLIILRKRKKSQNNL